MSTFEEAKNDPKAFADKLAKDSSIADDFSMEQLEELLNEHLDPTRQAIANDDAPPRYAKVTAIPAHQRFQMRFACTGLVGMLYRYLSEWHTTADQGADPITHQVYLEKMKRFNDLSLDEQKRLIVYEFLSSIFHYDPDQHVRKGYYPNKFDPDRVDLGPEKDALAKADAEKAERVKAKLEKLPVRRVAREAPEPTPTPVETEKKDIETDLDVVPAKKGKKKKKTGGNAGQVGFLKPLSPEEVAIKAQIPIEVGEETLKTYGVAQNGQLMIPPAPTAITSTIDGGLRDIVVANIPPVDWFYRLEHYMSVNFEELRKATTDIYAEQPWVDLMFNIHEVCENQEKSKEWDLVHGKDISLDIQTVKLGGWTVLASFKENRKKIVFDDKKTKLLSEMLERIENDKKVGAELLSKRKQRLKDDQLRKIGPDAQEFLNWRGDNKDDMKKYGIDESTARITQQHNKESMASPACPEDAVQIDMHIVGNGGKTTTKKEVFIEAEDPESIHMYRPGGQELGSGYDK